jgi:hypothetical protein
LPAAAAIRAEITRRAPAPHARTGGTTYLTNTAIVAYITNPTVADLAAPTLTFTLAGHHITAHLNLTSATYTWGDGTSTTYPTGGRTHPLSEPYTDRIPCQHRTRCDHYANHPYNHPGSYRITTTTHWTSTATIDNRPAIPIPGDIRQTDPAGHTITVRNAYSQLIDS